MKHQKQSIVVDCIVFNANQKTILIQQRSGSRKLFPYCWEFIGGHLENGETLEQCLQRELLEESNLQLKKIVQQIHEFDWHYEDKHVKNIIYLVLATGDLRLEIGKAIAFKWITRDDAHLILRAGQTTNGLYQAALKAFDIMDNFS